MENYEFIPRLVFTHESYYQEYTFWVMRGLNVIVQHFSAGYPSISLLANDAKEYRSQIQQKRPSKLR